MHTRVVRPERLAAEELDRFLEGGWYRIGQTLMTCRFILFEGELRNTIWTRLPLAGHRFRKGQRKLLARLHRDHRITVGPRTLDEQREALYTRYRAIARGERSPTLRYFLFEGADRDIFDTREIALWRGDRLVAFSWFDVGATTVQSLIGVYDPDLAKDSLGYGTMLLEAQWAQDNGFAHHYSGYVLPGEPAMDYKLRLGAMEYRDEHGRWRPWCTFDPADLPTRRMSNALDAVRDALVASGLPATRRVYPMFEAPAYDDAMRRCLDEPILVECPTQPPGHTTIVVTWDLHRCVYRIVRCIRAAGLVRSHLADDARPKEVEILITSEQLGMCDAPEEVVGTVRRHLTRTRPSRRR